MITVACLVSLLIFPFWVIFKKEPAPMEDQGIILGVAQSSPEATLDQTMLFAPAISDIFKNFPETAQTFQITQVPGASFFGLVAKPWSQRKRTMQDLLIDVSKEIALVPGVQIATTLPSPLPGGTGFPVEFVISSVAEPLEMLEFSEQLKEAAMKSGHFLYIDSDLRYDRPQSRIVFDHDKVASMGLNLQQVGGDLSVILSGGYTNYFSIQGRSYKVIPQVKRVERLTPGDLTKIYISGPSGTQVPLSTFATLKREVVPETLNHFQQLNSVKLQGVIGPGTTVDEGLKIFENEAAKILPRGYIIDYTGES